MKTGNLTSSNGFEDAGRPVQFEITKLRQFAMPKLNLIGPPSPSDSSDPPLSSDLSGTPTCVTSGGPANFWFAVGSDSGSVYLFDRARLVKEISESELARLNDTMMVRKLFCLASVINARVIFALEFILNVFN